MYSLWQPSNHGNHPSTNQPVTSHQIHSVACEQVSGRAYPFPFPFLAFFCPNREPVHRLNIQWISYHCPYLSIRGRRKWKQRPTDLLSREFTMVCKDQQSKASKAELCNNMQVPADPGAATPHKPACLGLNQFC